MSYNTLIFYFQYKKARGYTLYEIVVILAIIGLTLSFAVPVTSFQTLIHNNKNTYLQLKSIIRQAQEEAIRRNSNNVMVCPAKFNINDILYSALCNASNGDWSSGIISFTDLNGLGTYTGSNSDERINALNFDNKVTIKSIINKLTINSDGTLSAISGGSEWTFTLSQSQFGITYCRITTLNQYGYFSELAVC